VTESELKSIMDSYQAIKEGAEEEVNNIVSGVPAERENPGQLPQNQLADYYDECGTWHETLSQALSDWKASLKLSEERLEAVQSFLKTETYKETPASARNDYIRVDSTYVGANLEVLEFQTKVSLLEAHVSSLSKRMQRISRHFTTRMGQTTFNDRGGNMQWGGGYNGPRGGSTGASRRPAQS
jgi:chromosome segregation ATPase